MQIIVQEPSKARLCTECYKKPTLQNIRISEARHVYSISHRRALALVKILPSSTVVKSRFYWNLHLQWVQNQTSAENVMGKSAARDSLERPGNQRVVPSRPVRKVGQGQRPAPQLKRAIKNRPASAFCGRGDESASSVSTSASGSAEEGHARGEVTPFCFPPVVTGKKRDSSFLYESGSAEDENRKHGRVGEGQDCDSGMMHNYGMPGTPNALPTECALPGTTSTQIRRDVRYEYLRTEAAKAGVRLPHQSDNRLSGTLLHFLNGDWAEVAKHGIGINDFGAMVRLLQADARARPS